MSSSLSRTLFRLTRLERNNREERRTAERTNNQLLNARINLDQTRRREQELRTQNNNLTQ